MRLRTDPHQRLRGTFSPMKQGNVPARESRGEEVLLLTRHRPGDCPFALTLTCQQAALTQTASAYPNIAGSPHNDRFASSTPIAVAASTSLG